MTELAVRDDSPAAVAVHAPQLPVPAMNDIDSWTEIVGKVIRLANEIYDTPFIPDGLRGSAAAVAAAILSGREMGLGPMTSLANIDVIRGKPTQKPLLMRAMILSRGHKWEDVENNDTRAVVRGCRKGESTWTTVTFTADQAKRAQLDLGKWPADKLYARASSRLAKHRFADVIMGMASADDVEDGVDVEIAIGTGEVADGTQAPAIEAAKPRTAQRKPRDTGRPTAAAPAGPSAQAPQSLLTQGPAPAQTAPSGDLPPLPGEEEDPTTSGASSSARAPGNRSPQPNGAPSPSSPDGSATADDTDYDTPGTVTDPQIKRIWTTLGTDYGFASNEKDKARLVCARIVNHDLASSKDLSFREAGTVIDTLANWSEVAGRNQMTPRQFLDDVLNEARVEEVPTDV